MAGGSAEPTEEPTPERLRKARREGRVPISRELTGALVLAAVVGLLALLAPAAVARLLALFRGAFASLNEQAGGSPRLIAGARRGWGALAALLAVPLAGAFVVAVLVGFAQTGGLWSWAATRRELSRLSPSAGLRRIFSARAVIDVARGLVKVGIVAGVAVICLWPLARELPRLAGAPVGQILATMGRLARVLATRVVLALLALGLFDRWVVRRRHRRSLMMTRDEARREHREVEGDPLHKAERQRLHRELAEQRLLDDVRKADFVVVNPEHVAVALRYDRATDAAPIVVARGERLHAERIKQVAREAGVPIYRDISLARALHELPEGSEIPEALYHAVAEILRALWELRERVGAEAAGAGTGVAAAAPLSFWKRV